MSDWAEREIQYLRAKRWMWPAIVVSAAMWIGIIWGVASFVSWVL